MADQYKLAPDILFAGFFGGVAPSLVNLAVDLNNGAQAPEILGLPVALLIYAFLGIGRARWTLQPFGWAD